MFYQFLRVTLLTGVFVASMPAVDAASPYGLVLDAESRSYSDSFTIDGFLNGLENAPYDSDGDSAFTHSYIRIGANIQPESGMFSKAEFGLGLLTRYDYTAQYSSGTADIIYWDSRTLDVPNGDYALFLALQESQANGVWASVSYSFSPALRAYGRLSYLQADRLTEGTIRGEADFNSGDIQTLNANLEHYFHVDPIFDEDVFTASGQGYALDVGVQWSVTPDLLVSFEINDIASDIAWTGVPQIIANATTDTLSYNIDGTLNPRATFQGTRTIRDNPQTYAARLNTSYAARSVVRADYQLSPKWNLSQDVFNINDGWLTHSAVQYDLTDTLTLGAQAEWVSGALGGSLQWHGLRASLTTDSLDFKRARYLNVSLRLFHQF